MSAHESKPEWFQLADEDWAASPRAVDGRGVKARRKNPIRLMAISTPLLVLGAGLFVAQSQQAPQAFASASTNTVASAPLSPAASTPVENVQTSVVTDSAPAPVSVAPVSHTPLVSSSSSSSALSTLNSGLVLPAKGSVQSGDDGDGDDEGQDEGEDD